MAMLVISLLALVVPTWFRGFYLVSVRLSFALRACFCVGDCHLFFILVGSGTPLRGDPTGSPGKVTSCSSEENQERGNLLGTQPKSGPLDRLFDETDPLAQEPESRRHPAGFLQAS